jgi:hypothetical protein
MQAKIYASVSWLVANIAVSSKQILRLFEMRKNAGGCRYVAAGHHGPGNFSNHDDEFMANSLRPVVALAGG